MTIESNTNETNTADATSPEQSNPCKRELTIEIPADVVTAETESVVNRYQKLARIPGFRKGKVPASIVRQRFAEEIKNEIVEALVPRYFREETQKQNLLPVSQPRVTDLHLHDGEPLKFTASFEVLPDFKDRPLRRHPNRTGSPPTSARRTWRTRSTICASSTPPTVAVEEERPWRTATSPSSASRARPRKAKQDADSKPVEVDEVMVEIGGKNTIPEFTENLRGAKAGEQRSFEVKYADDFADKRLAGKTMTYEVDVKGIKTRSIPELNDEFAKELGADFNTLDELRNRLRENMKAEKLHEAEHQGKDQIVEELVKRNDFPVPEAMLDQQIDLRLERGLRALAAQGMRTEDMKRMDFARLRAGQREAALREVKASLILEQIADAGKDRSQRRRVRPRIGSAGDPVETDARTGARSFDAGWRAG